MNQKILCVICLVFPIVKQQQHFSDYTGLRLWESSRLWQDNNQYYEHPGAAEIAQGRHKTGMARIWMAEQITLQQDSQKMTGCP